MRNVRKEGLISNKKIVLLVLSVFPDRVPKGRELLLAYELYYQLTGRECPGGAVRCQGILLFFHCAVTSSISFDKHHQDQGSCCIGLATGVSVLWLLGFMDMESAL